MALTTVEALELVEVAGLRYSCDSEPGFRRRRRGSGFSYHSPGGTLVTGSARARIDALAIPPAWRDVWICRDGRGHVQATGRDAKRRKQYRYHADWAAVRDTAKYERLADFAAGLPGLRARVDADLRRRGWRRDKVLALVVAVLDETLIRIGNEAYVGNGTRGLTTLEVDHVETGSVRIEFDYLAKGGKRRRIELADRRLARQIGALQELPGQRLFTYDDGGTYRHVSSDDVNDFLAEAMGSGVTAKDFRTWGGTVTVAGHLATATASGTAATSIATSSSDAEDVVLEAIDIAAARLGNTRQVCRSAYVHPAVPEAFASGRLADTWRTTRSTGSMDRAERVVMKLLVGSA